MRPNTNSKNASITLLRLSLCLLATAIACNRKTEPPTIPDLPETRTISTFNPDWKAATLRFASVTYGYVSKEMLIPLGTFNGSDFIYEVLEVDSYYARITDGKNTGWVESSDLISFSPTIPPDSNEPGIPNHELIGKRITVIEWDAELLSGLQVRDRLQLGTTLTVCRVSDPWLFVHQKGGCWINRNHVVSFEEAIEYFTKKIDADPTSENYRSRGKVKAHRGSYHDAIADFTEAIKISPDNARAFNSRGIVWHDKGIYEKAVSDFTEAIRLDPTFNLAYLCRAGVWHELEEHYKAIDDYNEAICLDSCDAFSYDARGNVWQSLGLYEKALDDHNLSITLNPNSATAHVNRGHAWYGLCDYDKAISDFTEAIRLDPHYSLAFHSRGAALDNIQEFEKAVVDYNEAIRLDPSGKYLFANRARTWYSMGEHEKSMVDFKTALKDHPNCEYTLRSLAWALAVCPDETFVDGRRAIELATKACDLTDWKEYYCLRTLAVAYAADGQFNKAQEYLDAANQLDPYECPATIKEMRAAFNSSERYISEE